MQMKFKVARLKNQFCSIYVQPLDDLVLFIILFMQSQAGINLMSAVS